MGDKSMIRPLELEDREQLVKILVTCGSFTEEEIKVALELIDIYITDKSQKDYDIFVKKHQKTILNTILRVLEKKKNFKKNLVYQMKNRNRKFRTLFINLG